MESSAEEGPPSDVDEAVSPPRSPDSKDPDCVSVASSEHDDGSTREASSSRAGNFVESLRAKYFSKSLRLGSGVGGGADASSAGGSSKKQKVQLWDSVVNVLLVEGRNLLAMDDNGFSDPYVRFRLGTEKYKSKNAIKTLNPQWLEQFDLHMYTDQPKVLEISVWDKDFSGKGDFMGRCCIDLSSLEPETTHSVWQELEDGAGSLFLLLTISGSTLGSSSCVSDLTAYDASGNAAARQRALRARYGLLQSFYDWDDVGHLIVKVYKAQGLASADLGGKSDPFCVLELVNSRLQTHTEYKTLSPEWNKIFTFKVKDIHSVLELTVFDEDRDKKCEFLGKLAIPLLKIKNGEKKWYGLKDRKLKTRVKGQILLEMSVVYNPIKACVKTFNPKEAKFMQLDPKFKRIVFMRNLTRVKNIVVFVIDMGKFLNNCFLWESVPRSLLAFATACCVRDSEGPLRPLTRRACAFLSLRKDIGRGAKAEQRQVIWTARCVSGWCAPRRNRGDSGSRLQRRPKAGFSEPRGRGGARDSRPPEE
ncbi:hypothetical protein HPB48_001926 [Haemaphysalis longicornis]|uniref:C2 domain-containing protein n=1 Tax=Haemaphysalis longicornis TaxID=44386 RepID=A0A9J6G5T4_HAELO|nr:hypothetical protein HPB48_001926 [Haemaphysalis longicornis]